MKIGEVSDLTGIAVNTLRNWERYLELKIPRDEDGHRLYTMEWVEYFKKADKLHNQDGKSFDEIKKILKPPETEDPPVPEIEDPSGENINPENPIVPSEPSSSGATNEKILAEINKLRSEIESLKKGQWIYPFVAGIVTIVAVSSVVVSRPTPEPQTKYIQVPVVKPTIIKVPVPVASKGVLKDPIELMNNK